MACRQDAPLWGLVAIDSTEVAAYLHFIGALNIHFANTLICDLDMAAACLASGVIIDSIYAANRVELRLTEAGHTFAVFTDFVWLAI